MAQNKYKNLRIIFICLIFFIWAILTGIVNPFSKKSEDGYLYEINPETARDHHKDINDFYLSFSIIAAIILFVLFFIGRKPKKVGPPETTDTTKK